MSGSDLTLLPRWTLPFGTLADEFPSSDDATNTASARLARIVVARITPLVVIVVVVVVVVVIFADASATFRAGVTARAKACKVLRADADDAAAADAAGMRHARARQRQLPGRRGGSGETVVLEIFVVIVRLLAGIYIYIDVIFPVFLGVV